MSIDMDDPEHWARRRFVNLSCTPPRVRVTPTAPVGA
jgi:hypothetical protein